MSARLSESSASAPERMWNVQNVCRAGVGGCSHETPFNALLFNKWGWTTHVSYDSSVIILQGAQGGSQPRIRHSAAYKSQDIFVFLETFVFFKV